MQPRELTYLKLKIYEDDSGNLFVQDKEEGLLFVRGNVSPGKYDLAVIIEEDNSTLLRYPFSPNTPCGFQIFDEITSDEWNKLAQDYIRHKRKGEQAFDKWLTEKFAPLHEILNEISWYTECTPHPDCSDEENRKFIQASREFQERRANQAS